MDFSKIKPEFRKEIVREGTVYLDGMVKIATSADSRAASLAGIFTAAATAMTAGVAISLFNAAGQQLVDRISLILGGAAAAICFFVAAVQCIRAIQPIDFWLPGLAPENWVDDVSSGRDLDDCLGERAAHIQEQIAENLVTIKKNAGLFQWGTGFGIAAPLAGFMVWLVASLCGLAPAP